MKISFIGGGNMATALITGLLRKGWSASDIRVAEIDAQARERLARELGIRAEADALAAAQGAECIVFAVKPQQMREAAAAVRASASAALIITIAAGIRAADLARWLGGHARVVRAMPNTPALALAGMTGLYAAPEVSNEDRERAREVLAAAGRTLWVQQEEQMDAVTAVSGSGPAYVFYFIEALEQAATELGFGPEDARMLTLETFRGGVKLAAESAESVATLRARVTSKGGTTERAIAELDARGVRQAIVDAVHAAESRSRELGAASGADGPDARRLSQNVRSAR
jgi:pyrroline-5-carboxylate reductase